MARRKLSILRMSEYLFFCIWCFRSLTFLNARSLVINEDIDAIIARGEERTMELNSKYEGLNLEDLNNFKSDASVQQWEGEDFRAGVRTRFFFFLSCSHPMSVLFSRKKH